MVHTSDAASTHLTPREIEVLRLIVGGLSSKQTAARLRIAPKTVESYVEHVRLKLGATNRCNMVAIAVGRGLIWLADGDTD